MIPNSLDFSLDLSVLNDSIIKGIEDKVKALVPEEIFSTINELKGHVSDLAELKQIVSSFESPSTLMSQIIPTITERLELLLMDKFKDYSTQLETVITSSRELLVQEVRELLPQLADINFDQITQLTSMLSDVNYVNEAISNGIKAIFPLEVEDVTELLQRLQVIMADPATLIEQLTESVVDQGLVAVKDKINGLFHNLTNEFNSQLTTKIQEVLDVNMLNLKDTINKMLGSPDIIKLIDTHLGGVISRYEAFVGQKLEVAQQVISQISETVNIVMTKYEEIKVILDLIPNLAKGFTDTFKTAIQSEINSLLVTLPTQVFNELKSKLMGYMDDFLSSIF